MKLCINVDNVVYPLIMWCDHLRNRKVKTTLIYVNRKGSECTFQVGYSLVRCEVENTWQQPFKAFQNNLRQLTWKNQSLREKQERHYAAGFTKTSFNLNQLFPSHLFLYPLKALENLLVLRSFQEVQNGCIENKWFNPWKFSLEEFKLNVILSSTEIIFIG